MIDRYTVNDVLAMLPPDILTAAVFHARDQATSGPAPDTFTDYPLQKVRRRKMTRMDVSMAGEKASQIQRTFEIFEPDLVVASAPDPRRLDYLTDADGDWVFEIVYSTLNGGVHNCLA